MAGIVKDGAYIVPKLAAATCSASTQPRGADNDTTATHVFTWKYCFAQAERRLFASLHERHLAVVHSLLIFANTVSHFYGAQFEKDLVALLKCSFLWCVESARIDLQQLQADSSSSSSSNSSSSRSGSDSTSATFKAMQVVLVFLSKQLHENRLPHFFLDHCNVLEVCVGFTHSFLPRNTRVHCILTRIVVLC